MDDSYIVVNKPAGLPCMRHESNATEHVANCIKRALFSQNGAGKTLQEIRVMSCIAATIATGHPW
jgi:23S rRNA-/tRNA-specific pseudouridylate synthase